MSAQIFIEQLNVARWLLQNNTAEITDEDSLIQPEPGGNCLNWIVGHIVGARDLMLADVLGGEGVLSTETRERYNRGSDPIESSDEASLPFRDLLEAYETNHGRLMEILGAAYQHDLAFLRERRDELEAMAQKLLSTETLEAADVVEILGPAPTA